MESALSTSVLSKNPNSPLLKVQDKLSDGQIVDKHYTSYANNPDVHSVQVRKSGTGNLYEYPIYIKGSKSAQDWKQQMQVSKKSGLETAEIGGLQYSTKGFNAYAGNPGNAFKKGTGQQATSPGIVTMNNGAEPPVVPFSGPKTKADQILDAASSVGIGKKKPDPLSDKNDDAGLGDLLAEGALLYGNVSSAALGAVPIYGTAASAWMGGATDVGQFAKNVHDQGGVNWDNVGELGGDLAATGVGLIPFGYGTVGKMAMKAPKLIGKALKIGSAILAATAGKDEFVQATQQMKSAMNRFTTEGVTTASMADFAAALKGFAHSGRNVNNVLKLKLPSKSVVKPVIPLRSSTVQSGINQQFPNAVKTPVSPVKPYKTTYPKAEPAMKMSSPYNPPI
jgi:hypothetical protein